MATTPDEPSPPPAATQYEFTPRRTSSSPTWPGRWRFVGFFALLVGSLGVARMIVAWVKGVALVDASSLVLLFLGFWTLGAARAFQDVSNTQGRDISHIMQALGELRGMYSLLYWLLIIGIFLAALLLFVPTAASVVP